MDVFTKRPEPKIYPGVKIKTTGREVDFDYEKFMQSFLHTQTNIANIPIVSVETKKIIEFTWKKIGVIIIGDEPEKEVKKRKRIDTCKKIDPPVTKNNYFMNNRAVFIPDIQSKLEQYRSTNEVTCESMKEEFTLLSHQKLVQSYINIDTPYRGLLLFHGLGSGKTCSSIAIAEGIKPYKNIVVMTPASLETNYLQELKKCGSEMYKLNQHWIWTTSPTEEQLKERCFTEKDYRKHDSSRGIWINDEDGDANYDELMPVEQESIRDQIDVMIRKQYKFIHYNGINRNNFKKLIEEGNPFSNKLTIIDEAHNFVSKIVNKLSDKEHPSTQLYELLMRAENCKIVMLTGTPIINYSHEIAILFNMLRGYITTWTSDVRIDEDDMKQKIPDVDMVYKNLNSMMFTQLPDGFTRTSTPTTVTQSNFIQTAPFEERLEEYIGKKLVKEEFKAFPDSAKEFQELYVNIAENKLKNKHKLMFRMIGLASFFPDLIQLMPVLKESTIHRIPMSKTQFDEYTAIRIKERESEKPKFKEDDAVSGTYRIFSRLICNTTYPEDVRRVRPGKAEEQIVSEEVEEIPEIRGLPEFFTAIDASDYIANIKEYSPKYDKIMQIIQEREGLHLIYSQFLTIEGIALFSKLLNSRGYTEFKIKKVKDNWTIDVSEKDLHKPMYVTYIGTKSQEEKELIRNVFNKNWTSVPGKLRKETEDININIFMITSAGAEGISLKHVQYVHIMEPYWNPVRIDQVIGRARRICSHNTLPTMQQFVEVHMYIMEFPKVNIPEDLKRDLIDDKPGSTDEFLFSLAQRKRAISTEITNCIKLASIDCFLYDSKYVRTWEKDPTVYTYFPDHRKDITTDDDISKNVKLNQSRGVVKDNGKPFAYLYVAETDKEKFAPLYKIDTTDKIGYFNSGSVYDLKKSKVTTAELNKRNL